LVLVIAYALENTKMIESRVSHVYPKKPDQIYLIASLLQVEKYESFDAWQKCFLLRGRATAPLKFGTA